MEKFLDSANENNECVIQCRYYYNKYKKMKNTVKNYQHIYNKDVYDLKTQYKKI